MITLKNLNRLIQKSFPLLTLRKFEDKGYSYFFFEHDDLDNLIYEEKAVHVNALNRYSVERWVEVAKDFARDVAEKYA